MLLTQSAIFASIACPQLDAATKFRVYYDADWRLSRRRAFAFKIAIMLPRCT